MVVGLSAIAAFARTGKVAKALMMTVIGLILATVGEWRCLTPRASPWASWICKRVSFITLAMALFALPEAMMLVLDPSRETRLGR